jgi:hypothetical protein
VLFSSLRRTSEDYHHNNHSASKKQQVSAGGGISFRIRGTVNGSNNIMKHQPLSADNGSLGWMSNSTADGGFDLVQEEEERLKAELKKAQVLTDCLLIIFYFFVF